MSSLFCLVVFFCICYIYAKIKYEFWSKKKVKGPTPLPLVGNFWKVLSGREKIGDYYKTFYELYPNEKVVGLYRGFKPTILIRDPDLIKRVMITDFPLFQDRHVNLFNGELRKNLVDAEGVKWRLLRKALTPVFTPSKLKNMMPLMQQCVDEYIKYVKQKMEKSQDQDVLKLISKYTIRVIETCAFGLDNDVIDETENELSKEAEKLWRLSTFSKLLFLLDYIIPGMYRKFHSNDDLYRFFLDIVQKVIHQRVDEPMKRQDFMDLMIELKEQGKIRQKTEDGIVELEVDDATITAQAILFYAAGFETSSSTMSFMTHELVWNQDVQNKVYQEICKVLTKYNGEMTYDAVMEMTYLEQVLDETLRIHPVVGYLERKANANYTLPGTDITLPPDMVVSFSISGMCRDEKYFPNPDKFNPDNFSSENKQRLPMGVYMPFGMGPRNCIGMRFSKLKTKMGMAAFLKTFKIEPTSKTNRVINYTLDSHTLKSQDEIWVKISRR